MSSKSLTLFVMLIFVCLLYATNPTIEHFQKYIKTAITEDAQKSGGLEGFLVQMVSAPTAWLAKLATEREDFKLFSIYKVSLFGEEAEFIGVLNNFIRIK